MKTAVILAGGKGTRLRPYTFTIPKPLMPLGTMPILDVVLAQLAQHQFTNVVITVGYLSHLIEASVGDGSRYNLKVDYFKEDRPLGTAGCLARIQNLPSDILVMNGDLLTDLNYGQAMQFHLDQQGLATIAVHRREVYIDYGVVEMNKDQTLSRYIEKPKIPYTVSMGINVLNKKAIELIPPDSPFDMPQLMSKIVETGGKVSCFATDCYWQDIGRLDDFEQATQDFVNTPERFLPVK